MDNKILQKRRMMGFFIEATQKITETEGLSAITVRKVADLAGYNISTIYNYFKNLDHLVFYASMKYIRDYVYDLPNYILQSDSAIKTYRNIWRCYCKHSFSKPEIYYIVFWDKFRETLQSSITEYYQIFPEDLGHVPGSLLPMLLEGDIYKRDAVPLTACVREGYFREEDIDDINEMFLLVYQSMLLRLVRGDVSYTPEEAGERILFYQDKVIDAFRIK